MDTEVLDDLGERDAVFTDASHAHDIITELLRVGEAGMGFILPYCRNQIRCYLSMQQSPLLLQRLSARVSLGLCSTAQFIFTFTAFHGEDDR